MVSGLFYLIYIVGLYLGYYSKDPLQYSRFYKEFQCEDFQCDLSLVSLVALTVLGLATFYRNSRYLRQLDNLEQTRTGFSPGLLVRRG